VNEEIKNYAETLERERERIADGLREPLRNLGYDLKKVGISEGQGIVRQNNRPPRATISLSISADEIMGDVE
jgi:hypothetical protein